ncbi:hypothetical protein Trydic_g3149 [Trypoxylus dichotomus]
MFDTLQWECKVPLLGGAWKFQQHIAQYEQHYQIFDKLKADTFFTMIGFTPTLVTRDADFLRVVVNSKNVVLPNILRHVGRKFVGEGLMLSEGKQWKTQRKLLGSTFHYANLHNKIPILGQESDKVITNIEGELHKGTIDIEKYAIEYVTRTFCEILIGTSFDSIKERMSLYTDESLMHGSIAFERMLRPLEYIDRVYKLTKNFKIEQKIVEKRENLICDIIIQRMFSIGTAVDNTIDDKKDILIDNLLKLKRKGVFYNNQLVIDDIHSMFLGNSHTTPTVISFVLLLLAKNPDIQDKAFKEVEAILSEKSNDEDMLVSGLSRMVYLHAVIEEAMRLYTPVPYLMREVADTIEYNGRKLLKGTMIAVLTSALHRNPRYYVNPNMFMPERFLGNDNTTLNSYMPFGGGLRNCIGTKYAMMSMKTFLAKFLMKFTIESVNHHIDLKTEIALTSTNGFKVCLRQR